MKTRDNKRLALFLGVLIVILLGTLIWDLVIHKPEPLPPGLPQAMQTARVWVLLRVESYPDKTISEMLDMSLELGDGHGWKGFVFNPNRGDWATAMVDGPSSGHLTLILRRIGEDVAVCDGAGAVNKLEWSAVADETAWLDDGLRMDERLH